ncbi:unnamed protein product [Parnassius mnemosyne]|uniref:Neurotrophin 1 n=1 Tax=Parnassius mnemosyne TaxID=213953 RepID=A0AAV1M968_9NEOP
MSKITRVILILAVASAVRTADEGLESSNPHEVMIAQESSNHHTLIAPPVRIIKPNGVTNSHRPQYDLDSLEEEIANIDVSNFFEATTRKSLYKTYNSHNSRYKETMVRDAVLKALERRDHVGKFAQILPIIRGMSGSQRVALASLVASQVSTPPGRLPLNLSQVRSMFGNENNSSSELMLPILLDMANMIRRAVRSGKEQRDVKLPLTLSQTKLLRRSFIEETSQSDEFDPGVVEFKSLKTTTTKPKITFKNLNTRIRPQITTETRSNKSDVEKKTVQANKTAINSQIQSNTDDFNFTSVNNDDNENNTTKETTTMEPPQQTQAKGRSMTLADNITLDLTADDTNHSLEHQLPVAEKLRSFSRYVDKKGNIIRRGTYNPKSPLVLRRTTAEPTPAPSLSSIGRRRPFPAKKLPTLSGEQKKCEHFTNTVCLHIEDYPTEAIIQSIRRNKAAGALLADIKDPGEGAVDGITAAQEAKYTAEHYLVSNRRGDTANRDFASAGEAGFMCPSTVKYARPQRARATSGQWKYIVNTGEHTQTLRLEKCLKPKESCTYLTDNFKSKCVQVYNYHRLLTWDQQNGLHMDIFKVPTCCSCHIEGYSVAFPPLGHRIHETSSEHFPGEELSPEHSNQAFEAVQSVVQKPSVTKSHNFPFKKPLDTFPSFIDNHNSIPGPMFSDVSDDDELNNLSPHSLKDSYGNSYFPDSVNQETSRRNVRKPPSARNPSATDFNTATLPSYLEPPTPSGSSSLSYFKDILSKYKNTDNLFKRGISRLNRRPISNRQEDLVPSGTSALGTFSSDSPNTEEELPPEFQSYDSRKTNPNTNVRGTIAPKLFTVTTEKQFSTLRPKEEKISNSKRVNYNYHPIIEFFEEDDKEGNESIDREDNISEFMPSPESEWKPISLAATQKY